MSFWFSSTAIRVSRLAQLTTISIWLGAEAGLFRGAAARGALFLLKF
jgi:hypothetical protein